MSNDSKPKALFNSDLIFSGHHLQKIDRKGRILESFDLRIVPEITVGKQQVYGCVVLALIFIYLGVILPYFCFDDRESGLTYAVMLAIIGLFILWFAKDAYQYFISFTYVDRLILFPLQDSRVKIEKFLDHIKEMIQNENHKITINNMLGPEDGNSPYDED